MSSYILIVEEDHMLADTLVALLDYREQESMVVPEVEQALEIRATSAFAATGIALRPGEVALIHRVESSDPASYRLCPH